MKKAWIATVLLALLLLVFPAAAEQAEETDDWTVLVYMCGSDLESKYSFGTGNLEEIASVVKPTSTPQEILDIINARGITVSGYVGRVNVLIETGGAKTWHAEHLGMNIRPDVLQRWHFNASTEASGNAFELEKELPLASMANPETLADFIRWGKENYPAKKYALVLWNHGGGSATGIFIDELFGGEYMTLDMLKQALRDGGAHFEAIVFDACLMANLETACAVRDYASWMVASEELVAGKGTAMGEWLQELFYVPKADGRLLGRWICDTAMIKYADTDDQRSQELLTWSVINLGKVEKLANNFDNLFEMMCGIYPDHPQLLNSFTNAAHYYEAFGTGHENMYDLAGIMYDSALRTSATSEMQMVMQEALADCVDYCVRGAGRPAARGISFCYATNFKGDRLDIYARNCPSPHYLAILDAISPWTAPDWVYEQVEKVPEPTNEKAYQVTVEKRIWKNGSPAFAILEGDSMISSVAYNLYKLDEATGQTIRLGEVPVVYDADAGIFRIYDLFTWPSINGNLCEIELQNKVTIGDYNLLYNVPLMIDTDIMNMRVAYWFDTAQWEVLGLWEGYDNDSSQFNRNVMSLSQVAGREYKLLYEVEGEKRAAGSYTGSPAMIMYRSMELDEILLPAGTYYIKFTIYDAFMRPMHLDTVEFEITEDHVIRLLGEPWEGTKTVNADAYYTE